LLVCVPDNLKIGHSQATRCTQPPGEATWGCVTESQKKQNSEGRKEMDKEVGRKMERACRYFAS
jgi:hypothetical protein